MKLQNSYVIENVARVPINIVMSRKLVKFQVWADCPFNVHCRAQVDALPDHERFGLCRWMKCEEKVKVIYAC